MAIKSAVRHGMGVGVGFEETVKSEITSGEFKILRVCGLDLEGETFIIYPKKRPLFHLAQEFLGLLRGTRNGNQELGSTVGKVPQSNRRSRYPLDSNLPAFQR
jgi:DNA-binding transcriptional LysR family regulator